MIKEKYKNIPEEEFVPLEEGIDPVFLDKYKINKKGEIWSIKNNKILLQTLDDRYYKIHLCIKEKRATYRVHRLVAYQFLVKTDRFNVVDHIDRDTSNNNVNNLRWVSTNENNSNRKNKALAHPITRLFYKIDINGSIIDKIPISQLRTTNRHYSEKINKAIRDNKLLDGYFWRCVTTAADRVYSVYGYNPIWKESISLKGLYVSELGTIKRGNVETLGSIRRGYYVASIDSMKRSFSMNRLIAESFIVNRKLSNDEVVDHLNTNRLDNRVSNLRVCSRKENMNNPITIEKLKKKKNKK